MTFNIFKILVLTVFITGIFAFHSEDEVSGLPDYPFYGKIHSGYLDIKNEKKKLHYILIESDNDPVNDPVLLWLNGGPGCSSLGGFSQEHGPALFIPGTAEWKANPYSFNRKANVIYLESPAGVGFSYIDTEDEEDYKTDDVLSGQENLEAIINFFERFPELQSNEFFISGESYAGIYIPYLATNILNHNKSNNKIFSINLKGIIVGNGVTDWNVDADVAMIDYGYNHALYSSDLRETFEQNCQTRPNQAKCDAALDEINGLISQVNVYSIYDICFTPTKNFGEEAIEHPNKYRYTPWIRRNTKKAPQHLKFFSDLESKSNDNLNDSGPPCVDDKGFNEYWNREDVKSALRVKSDIHFQVCSDVIASNYTMDKERGSYYLYPALIKSGIRIFKFSGDTDSVVPFNGTEKWIKNLNLPILEKWRSWNIGDKANPDGFVTKYDGLTFVVVRGAGHMVAQFKPQAAAYLLEKFLTGGEL